VRDLQPIEASKVGDAVEGWRPLIEKPEPKAEDKKPEEVTPPQSVPEVAEMLSSLSTQALASGLPGMPGSTPPLSTQQQVQMWQQAALLGLTSAALAMLMVERLIKAKDEEDDKTDQGR